MKRPNTTTEIKTFGLPSIAWVALISPALVVFFIPWPLYIQAALTLIGCGVAIGALVLALTFCITPIKSLYLSLHKT